MQDAPAPPSVVADFLSDYVAIARQILVDAGVKLAPAMTDDQVSFALLNALKRHIDPNPRQVLLAKTFQEPGDVEARRGLATLRSKFEHGHDVNPHLSTAMKNVGHRSYNDKLLNHWGIQHFHLGDVSPPQTFAGRTDLTLFAMVRPDAVYFIDVLPHGNWSRQALLEIVHENWPDLLHKVEGLKPSRDQLTDEEVATVRKKGGMTMPQMADGTMYFPPGGGFMASGLSTDVLYKSDLCFHRLETYQEWVEANVAAITDGIRDAGHPVPETIRLRLAIDDDGIAYAVEDVAKVKFRLGPLM